METSRVAIESWYALEHGDFSRNPGRRPPGRRYQPIERTVAATTSSNPYFSSSNVTATSALAESLTLLPSTPAIRPLSMKWWWPLCEPSPLSFLVSLIRPPSNRSTVPTCTPSAPLTSICSLISIAVLLQPDKTICDTRPDGPWRFQHSFAL